MAVLRIGNAQGFWGDRVGMAAQLVAQEPRLNYLTLDYLAEVSLSLLAMQKGRTPSLGYASDFLEELKLLIPFWKKGSPVKIVVNAGGLNPKGCAAAAVELLHAHGFSSKKIGIVTGDDVISLLKQGGDFFNLDTGESIQGVRDRLVSANAYLGADPIVQLLKEGADIVITGRVADPSLVVACCMAHYGWKSEEYGKIAQATVAGHLIECGTQVTGGIATHWLDMPHPARLGFPVIEMEEDGTFVITKPEGTGGAVTEETVKEQLLYELGDPENYLSPDVRVSFLSLELIKEGKDRIGVTGAQGFSPPSSYKVSATFSDGFRAEGILALFGRDLEEKARRMGQVVLERVQERGYLLEETSIELIGGGDLVPQVVVKPSQILEGMLRIAVKSKSRDAVECFTKEIAPLVTSGAQGTTGYFSGRPKVHPVFGFWPCLIPVDQIVPQMEMVVA